MVAKHTILAAAASRPTFDYVNGVAAPIFSISGGTIQFQIPYEISPGDAVVRVDRDGNTGNSLAITILPAKPKITTVVNQNGQTVSIAGAGPQAQVSPGDTLTFTGYGFGQTNPIVTAIPAREYSDIRHCSWCHRAIGL